MSQAQTRVLSTPELLEAILAHLPPSSLLQAQRISCTFQSVIQTSPTLQQALYLRPARPKPSGDWTINPLLRDCFLPWLVIAEDRWEMPSYEALEMLDWVKNEKRREAMLHADASWRKMFLIQPPPKTLTILRFCHSRGGDYISNGEVSFADEEQAAVTMGALYDIPHSFLRCEEFSSFSIRVYNEENAVPKMVLHLIYTAQCYPEPPLRSKDLSSNAKKTWDFHRIEIKRQQDTAAPLGRVMFTGNGLLSDLTTERGGVPSYEFQKWLRERAPVSSLLSDVR